MKSMKSCAAFNDLIANAVDGICSFKKNTESVMYRPYGLSGCHPVEHVSMGRKKNQWIGRGWARFGVGGR